QGQNVTFVRPDRWLRGWKRVDGEEAMGEVYRRYLRTFGPATHLDFASWWGDQPGRFKATRVRLEAEELEQVSIEGTTAWAVSSDVRRTARMEPSTSVRLLPNFDAYVMGFRPRERFHDGRVTARIFRTAGWISPVVLVGGRAEGVWGYERASRGVEVTVEPFGKLPAATKKALAEEVDRLGRFLTAPARVRYA
ncbi:MAG TPA: crosslink repair DNA glycosylase YcaQ family protein, partial [Actinomycetota bacterium]|nr:crosslink repair DNA glycosylase YcaQ family protein [Actinomycetota bacterium]